MGWFSWGSSSGAEKIPVDWTFLPLTIDADATEGEYYLTIDLGSMRTPETERGYTKWYGAVHSFVSVPTSDATDNAKFRVVTTRSNLKDIDATNLDRVLQFNKRLLGPIPYRGGMLTFEVGLYSVKSA